MEYFSKQMIEMAMINNNRRLEAIEDEIEALRKEQIETQKMNKVFKNYLAENLHSHDPDAKDNGYNKNWTFEQKIDFILNLKSPLPSRLIVDDIMKMEPLADRSKIMRGVSSLLSIKSVAGGKYQKSQNERNENVFMLRSHQEEEEEEIEIIMDESGNETEVVIHPADDDDPF